MYLMWKYLSKHRYRISYSDQFRTSSQCYYKQLFIHNNDAQLDIIYIYNVSNVEISGCEFYQNKGQDFLIQIFLGYSFDMDNCSIYDNDVKDTIFELESSSFESTFTITNCLFSNNTSGGKLRVIDYTCQI